MAKKQNKATPVILLLIIAIALFYFASQQGFLGAMVTTCENTEPTSLQSYIDTIDDMNGTISVDGSISIQQETGLVNLQKYATDTPMGTIQLITTSTFTCSQLLQIMSQQENNSQFLVLSKRQVLASDEGFTWCNHANTIVLRSKTIQEYSKYYETFEVCTTTSIEDVTNTQTTNASYVNNPAECERLNGNWTTNQECLCSDGEKLLLGNACPDTETPTSISTTPPPTSGSPSIGIGTSTQTTNKTRTIGIITAIIASIFTLYWFFEKGPKKGFFKKT